MVKLTDINCSLNKSKKAFQIFCVLFLYSFQKLNVLKINVIPSYVYFFVDKFQLF